MRNRVLLSTVLVIGALVLGAGQAELDQYVYLPMIRQSVRVYNPGFELGYGGGCEYYVDGDGPRLGCYQEQMVPAGWVVGWNEQAPCRDGWVTGRPEIRNAERWADPRRVHSGEFAAHGFNFFYCADFWFSQYIDTTPGRTYQAEAQVQTWHSDIWMRLCLDSACSAWFTSPDEWTLITTPEVVGGDWTELRVECWSEWPYRNQDCYVDDVVMR